MQGILVNIKTQTETYGSGKKGFLLLNLFLNIRRKESHVYIYPPGYWGALMASFSGQVKKWSTVITIPIISHYNSPAADRWALLLLGQSCPCIPGQYFEVSICILIPQMVSKKDSPTPTQESSRTRLTAYYSYRILGLAKDASTKPKLSCDFGSPKSNHLCDIV